jgi:hypothetical protein
MKMALGSLSGSAYDALMASFAARGVDPAQFSQVRPGRSYPDPVTCLRIQCGDITQAEAGLDLLADCSFAGFSGSQSCADPLCSPYCGNTAQRVARASQPLPVSPRIDRLFLDSTGAGARGCDPVYWGPKFGGPYDSAIPCGDCGESFINAHPLLAVALLAAASYGIYRWRAGR